MDFNVRGKADNGLLYGLKLQLETVTGHESSSETLFDEAYVYIGGPWGRLEFGDTDDVVAGGLVIYAPSVGIGQVDGDYGSFSRLSLDDYYPFYPDIGTSTKVNYYTPGSPAFRQAYPIARTFPTTVSPSWPFDPEGCAPRPPPLPRGACLRPAPLPERPFHRPPSGRHRSAPGP